MKVPKQPDNTPRRLRLTTAVLLPATLVMMGAAKGCLSKPTVDTIVTTSPIEVKGGIQYIDGSGNVTLMDGKAQLKVNGSWLAEVSTVDQVWTYPSVSLINGVNTLDGKTRRWNGFFWVNGVLDPFLLERRNGAVLRLQRLIFVQGKPIQLNTRV